MLQHHERYDGKGYPLGLKGDNINYLARLLAVVDAFDAMTSLRPYQPIKTYKQAIAELRRCSGTQFDPQAAEAFIKCIENRNGLSVDHCESAFHTTQPDFYVGTDNGIPGDRSGNDL